MNKNSVVVNKLLIVTCSDFPYGTASAKLLRLIGVGLVENSWRVEVLLQRGQGNAGEVVNEKKCSIENGVFYKYYAWRTRPKNIFLKIIDSVISNFGVIGSIVMRKITKNADVVIVYNHSGIQNLLPLVICKIMKIHCISYVSEWIDRKDSFLKWHLQYKWYDFIFRMKIVNLWFDGLIMPSNFLYMYYIKQGFDREKLYILPTVVELPDLTIVEEKQYPKRENIRIGFCGKPNWANGGEFLIQSFKNVIERNSSVELLLMGDRLEDPNLLPGLKKLSCELGIYDKVIFTGMIPQKRVTQLLLTCDILVLPRPAGTFAEAGFPTKLGEYVASKKPVVVTEVGDIPLYLKHKISAMLSRPGNIDDFANNILWLINNQEEAKKNADKAFEWAAEYLQYNNAARKLGIYLNSIIYTKNKLG